LTDEEIPIPFFSSIPESETPLLQTTISPIPSTGPTSATIITAPNLTDGPRDRIHDERFSPTIPREPSRQRKRDIVRAQIEKWIRSVPVKGINPRPRRRRDVLRALFRPAKPRIVTDKLSKSQLKSLTGDIPRNGGSLACYICLENKRTTLFAPCGHMGPCGGCSEKLKGDCCPVCRAKVETLLQVQCVVDDAGVGCLGCGKPKDGIFGPCRHVCFCIDCCEGVRRCPVCQKTVLDTMKVFWS
jgi:hypothetical protein